MTRKDVTDWMTADISPAGKVLLWRVFITMLLFWYISYGFGFIPGTEGFAQAGDTKELMKEVREYRKESLERDIMDNHMLRCMESDERVRRLYEQRLQRLLRRYLDFTGTHYPLQPCPSSGLEFLGGHHAG